MAGKGSGNRFTKGGGGARTFVDMGAGRTENEDVIRSYTPRVRTFNAEMFCPHDVETKVFISSRSGDFRKPHVSISYGALLDMYYIAGYAGHNEVGWLGTVVRNGDELKIEEVILFEQEVTSSSTELNTDHIAKIVTQMLKDGQIDKVNLIKFWGHVHPGNSTSPSGQDDETMNILSDGNEWFLRGIFGRNGRAQFWLYDYKRGLIYDDIPWKPYMPISEERKELLCCQVDELVKSAYSYSVTFSRGNAGYPSPAHHGKTGFARQIPVRNADNFEEEPVGEKLESEEDGEAGGERPITA